MAQVTISAHQRGGNKRRKHQVSTYLQNRKEAKPRSQGGAGYTACQRMIAKVYNFDNPFNATRDQLRNDPKWRSYVCHCTESTHWAIITGGGDGVIKGASPTKDFTFEAPSWGSKTKTHKVTIKGKVQTIAGKYLNSRCGVQIWQPTYQRALQGRSIAYLRASA